ncbi:DUF4982 domain-containing protein [Salinimicrobium tongyeongense]|uniref:DUF4982 domain-containing protein n=1 Tax=Salinimicrobium tongyeongense TaxID=2809707 RepID=A0ABY6NSE4_9FLAO|nr:DUF4982 domain-containing protein [Salinimicrobium tongyeongense]UZH55408.1 DUF4982 domain-containing protein [Salinimicrobium tongyeongense]
MRYLANYWQPGSTTDVTVYSNTEEVELYLNGELIEKKKPERTSFSDELWYPPFTFSIPEYVPGELKAAGFIDGKEVASHVVRTPGEVSKMALSADISGKEIARETSDVIFIYAKLLDENGTLVHNATLPVTFKITSGENAELIGENPVKAEAGIATILLRTKELKGPVSIEAGAEGVEAVTITLK